MGRGVATGALAIFLRDTMKERPVYARVAADNAGSLRVLAKCGFAMAGEERAFAPARGHEVVELILRLDA